MYIGNCFGTGEKDDKIEFNKVTLKGYKANDKSTICLPWKYL